MISFILTDKNYIDFQLDYLRNSANARRQLFKTRLLLAAVYVITAAVVYLLQPGPKTLIVIMVLGCVGAVQIFFWDKFYRRIVMRAVKRMLQSGNANKTLGKKQISLDGDDLVYEEESGTTRQKISQLKKLRESASCVFLYRDEISAYIIPNTAFPSPEEKKSFLEAIASRLPRA